MLNFWLTSVPVILENVNQSNVSHLIRKGVRLADKHRRMTLSLYTPDLYIFL